MESGKYFLLIILTCVGLGFGTADAQENLAQEVYAIFERNCLNCHGPHGCFTEQLVIQSKGLTKLRHQPAGIYQTRSRAAYWDGKNEIGEPVASGVYFYTFTVGDFTATRKMLIRK